MTRGPRKLVLFAAFAVLPSFASAQTPPISLAETLSWMDNTYNPHGVTRGSLGHGLEEIFSLGKLYKRRHSVFKHKDCAMTLISNDDPAAPLYSEIYTSKIATFSLKDIDSKEIKTYLLDPQLGGIRCSGDVPSTQCSIAEIEISTFNQQPLIDQEYYATHRKLSGPGHMIYRVEKTYAVELYVDDAEYAAKFVKALRHAVALCGGNASTF